MIGYKKDRNGQVVLSKLDEGTLKAIAQTGNGRYYRAAADGRELDILLGEIDNLQKAQLQSRFEIRHIERFQLFLGLALLALVISEMIPDRLAERAINLKNVRLWRKRRTNPNDAQPIMTTQ